MFSIVYLKLIDRLYKESTANDIFVVIIFAPIMEELVFRGLPILLGSENIFGIYFLISHIIFVVSHRWNFSHGFIFVIPFFLGISLFLAYLAIKYGLIYAVIFHILYNGFAVINEKAT